MERSLSLKHFHILFIALSILLSLGFGAWGVRDYFSSDRGTTHLVLGLLSFALAGALVVYAVFVSQKLRRL